MKVAGSESTREASTKDTCALIGGDCCEIMATLPANYFDALVTDPPYHLTQLSRGGSSRVQGTGPFRRVKLGTDRGFMGQTWDGNGVAFSPDTWKKALRVLKPGAHLLAFGGSRTYHRLVCAIEDAGFEIRDSLQWLYATGFPKSLDVSKAMGNLGGARWEGWGTALKPAHESIVVARKPLIGKVTTNLLRYNTGALNIEGCRISPGTPVAGGGNNFDARRAGESRDDRPAKHGVSTNGHSQGRWPANVLLDEATSQALDAQSGIRKTGAWSGKRTQAKTKNTYGTFLGKEEKGRETSQGGASRFFFITKPSPTERAGNTHPTLKPLQLMRYLVRLVTPAEGIVFDPFAGSGTTGVAAHQEGFYFLGCELVPEYLEIARKRLGL